MARVKRGTTSLKHRKYTLLQTKGYRNGRNNKEREANEAIFHAGAHAFHDRRKKKNVFRRLWNVRINAAVRKLGLNYSNFIDLLKKKNVELDRKVLATIAQEHPDSFERIVKKLS